MAQWKWQQSCAWDAPLGSAPRGHRVCFLPPNTKKHICFKPEAKSKSYLSIVILRLIQLILAGGCKQRAKRWRTPASWRREIQSVFPIWACGKLTAPNNPRLKSRSRCHIMQTLKVTQQLWSRHQLRMRMRTGCSWEAKLWSLTFRLKLNFQI